MDKKIFTLIKDGEEKPKKPLTAKFVNNMWVFDGDDWSRDEIYDMLVEFELSGLIYILNRGVPHNLAGTVLMQFIKDVFKKNADILLGDRMGNLNICDFDKEFLAGGLSFLSQTIEESDETNNNKDGE